MCRKVKRLSVAIMISSALSYEAVEGYSSGGGMIVDGKILNTNSKLRLRQ